MKELPDGVVTYKKTQVFDENSIPLALLKEHNTKVGTWGKIVIIEGQLLYTINTDPIEEQILTPLVYGVVEPQVLHFVKPIGRVKFFVEFLK